MATIYRWAQIAFPYSGTKLWGGMSATGEGGFNSIGGSIIPVGVYEPRIKRFPSEVTFGGFDLSNSIRFPQADLVIDDADDEFGNILGSDENVSGSAVTIKAVAVENGAVLDSMSFTGVLASWSLSGEKEYTLVVRADDTAYNTKIIKPIRQEDWPIAPDKSVWGQPAPIIIGLHDSAGTGDKGARPVTYVDDTSFLGLVSWGWVNVLRAYKNNVRQTSGYSVSYVVRGGQMWTLLDYTASQAANTWTVDVQGVESVGDGSGSAINTPGDVALWFLRNLVFGSPKRGAWLTSGGDIEVADFALATMAVRAAGRPYANSSYITTTTAQAWINSWGSTNQLFPYISPAGNIGAMYHDPQERAVNWNNGSRWYRYTEKDFDSMDMEFDQDGLVGGVTVTAQSLDGGGVGWQPLTVINPLSKALAIDSITLDMGPAFQ
jgi:hypothetical protein